MIIAVDFDGTLQIDDAPNVRLFNQLIQSQRQGHTVILWTCRDGKRLAEAVNYCMRYGLRPNYINSNAIETIRKLGYDPRKVLADVYIDDKAVRI